MRLPAMLVLIACLDALPARADDPANDPVTYIGREATSAAFAKGPTARRDRHLQGQWRFSDTTIVETTFPAAGPEGQPTGAAGPTYDYTPHAGARDFDDRQWTTIPPGALAARRGAGRLSFVWYRLRLHVPDRTGGIDPTGHTLVLDLSLDDHAEGFAFTEGPVWRPATRELLFSDPNRNTISRYAADGTLGVFRHPSGYAGADIAEYHQPGANGLALDRMGRVTSNEHGNRRVVRLDDDAVTVLADRFENRSLNSPDDLVYRSDGMLFFTDPPFGLPKGFDDRRKALPFSGVFALSRGTMRLVTRELSGPNGLAFSPDERTLYVGNWDESRKVVMRYEIAADGTAGAGHVFADLTGMPGEDAIDGVKVDADGHVYVSGPGGLHVYSAAGERLGLIVTPRHVHNMAWGDEDERTLYLCARDHLYRLRVAVPGAPFAPRHRPEGTPQ